MQCCLSLNQPFYTHQKEPDFRIKCDPSIPQYIFEVFPTVYLFIRGDHGAFDLPAASMRPLSISSPIPNSTPMEIDPKNIEEVKRRLSALIRTQLQEEKELADLELFI